MLGKTYVYTYDNGGNRTGKVTYAYTTGTLGAATATESYTYGNSAWKDQLTSYNGTAISYDAIGNPKTFNGYTLSWHGRQLKKMTKSGSTLEFLYNADGIRTSKEVNNVEHIYTLNGTQIVSESWGNNLLIYLYDESGSPIGMQYRTSSYAAYTFDTFYFEKNLQGDIVAVYNANGVKVLSYTYDAWGNHTTTWHNSSGTNINATYNPFRYRGYYYDTETGLYYLQSRYYNPAWGRFLNVDAYISTGTGLLGYNMYAYCGNNPATRMDSGGGMWQLIPALHPRNHVVSIMGSTGGSIGAGSIQTRMTPSYSESSSHSTWLIRSNTAAYDAALGGYCSSGAGSSYSSLGQYSVSGAVTVKDNMAVENTKTVYRSVSEQEAHDIIETGQFRLSPYGMDCKQFGYNLEETRIFGQKMNQTIIVSATVPESVIQKCCGVGVDINIFKSGTLTVYSGDLDMFNQAVRGTIRFIP